MLLRNVGLSPNYTALQLRRPILHGQSRHDLKSNKQIINHCLQIVSWISVRMSDHKTVTVMLHFNIRSIKILLPETSLNTQGLFFRKVGCSRNDVSSKMFHTDKMISLFLSLCRIQCEHLRVVPFVLFSVRDATGTTRGGALSEAALRRSVCRASHNLTSLKLDGAL
jgi:hypothetical protein